MPELSSMMLIGFVGTSLLNEGMPQTLLLTAAGASARSRQNLDVGPRHQWGRLARVPKLVKSPSEGQ
ncbi:MAG: hypothetical protein JRN35_02555 [Nitrososphaerota archaeon]|nr:hypothetical protein [Nitrososphaerota archaeon]